MRILGDLYEVLNEYVAGASIGARSLLNCAALLTVSLWYRCGLETGLLSGEEPGLH